MEIWEWIVLGVAVAAAVLLALAFVRVRQRRTHLKDRFGREYQRTVEMDGTGGARDDSSSWKASVTTWI